MVKVDDEFGNCHADFVHLAGKYVCHHLIIMQQRAVGDKTRKRTNYIASVQCNLEQNA